jgi:hypothetical protein
MQPVTPSTPTQDPIEPQVPPTPTQPSPPTLDPLADPQSNPSVSPDPTLPQQQPKVDPFTPPPKQPSFNDSPIITPSPTNNKKKIMMIVGGVILLALIAGAIFALTSKSDPVANDSSALTDRELTTDEDVVIEETPDSEKTELPLTGKAVTNELGFTVTATKLVRNLSTENKGDDEEVVLLDVSISTDGTYTGGPGATDLRILDEASKEFRKTYSVPETELTALGYTPLSSTSSPKVGSPNVGYVAFAIPKGSKSLTLRLKQGETKIIGGGTIAAKDFDIKLTD